MLWLLVISIVCTNAEEKWYTDYVLGAELQKMGLYDVNGCSTFSRTHLESQHSSEEPFLVEGVVTKWDATTHWTPHMFSESLGAFIPSSTIFGRELNPIQGN